MIAYDNWQQFPMDEWRWPNFQPHELASRGDGKLGIDEPSLDRLQALRTAIGKPFYINSAYRSPEHNARVGGAKNSQHLQAKAFDVSMQNQDPFEFEAAARQAGFTGFGFYKDSNFIHIDTGPAREWGERWWSDKPPRTSLMQSTTLQATAGAAVSVTGGVGAVFRSLSPTNQTILLCAAIWAGVFLLWIARERIKKWAKGIR